MNKLKLVSILLLIILVLLGTTSFASTGKINAPNGLILRKEASKGGEVITTISDKASVEVIEKSDEWYKVKYGNYEGYVFAEYVTVEKQELEQTVATSNQPEAPTEGITSSNEQENTNTEVQAYPQTKTVKSNLKIYIIPSVTSKVIQNVEQSKTITINYVLNNWSNITYENTNGWVRNYFIDNETSSPTTPEQNTVPENKNQEDTQSNDTTFEKRKGYVNVTTSANVRETASASANVITTLTRNTEVSVVGEEGDFYKIKYKDYTGYISKSLISDKAVEVTSRSSTDRTEETQISAVAKSSEQTTQNSAPVTTSTTGENVVTFAKKYLGYNYVSGGTTPNSGFDCTGFTYFVYNSCGYSLSRLCSVQSQSGTEVSKENLQAGDLLLFNNGGNGSIGHVGIYIGGGSFIHAANSRRGVVTDTINSGYYNTYYYQARRIVN